jgi:integration host factor subunit beta
MNKIDVIMTLVEKKNLTEKQAAEIVNLIFKNFTNELKTGGRIEIRNFGIFTVRGYKAYKGRDSRTGKTVAVKPKKLPYFKVGRELKKMVDEIKKG